MEHVVDKIVAYIKGKVDVKVDSTGIILGYDFAKFFDKVEEKQEIMMKDIPDMKVMGSDMTENKFVFGKLGNVNVIVACGRLHYNLGYNIEDIANFIFVFKELGCKRLIITSSLASLNKKIIPSDIVTATDHINLTGRNPLYKCTYNKYGTMFIDTSDAYDKDLIDKLCLVAKRQMHINVKKGIVAEYIGPTVETVSESNFIRNLGADVVGFNICCEVVACKYCNLPVVLYGIVTNYASVLSKLVIKREDLVHNKKMASNYYLDLLEKYIISIA